MINGVVAIIPRENDEMCAMIFVVVFFMCFIGYTLVEVVISSGYGTFVFQNRTLIKKDLLVNRNASNRS